MKKWVSISVTNYLGGRGKPPPTPLKGRFFAEVRSSHLLLPVVVVTKSVLQAYVEQSCKLGVPNYVSISVTALGGGGNLSDTDDFQQGWWPKFVNLLGATGDSKIQ